MTYTRAKQVKITYQGLRGRPVPANGWGEQLLGIDGEDLKFKKQLILDCIPGNIEFLFDSKQFYKDQKVFK